MRDRKALEAAFDYIESLLEDPDAYGPYLWAASFVGEENALRLAEDKELVAPPSIKKDKANSNSDDAKGKKRDAERAVVAKSEEDDMEEIRAKKRARKC